MGARAPRSIALAAFVSSAWACGFPFPSRVVCRQDSDCAAGARCDPAEHLCVTVDGGTPASGSSGGATSSSGSQGGSTSGKATTTGGSTSGEISSSGGSSTSGSTTSSGSGSTSGAASSTSGSTGGSTSSGGGSSGGLDACTPDCTNQCRGGLDGCGGACPTNRCPGCCDSNFVCQPGDAGPACGSGGGACDVCASPAYCEDATVDGGHVCCTPRCADQCAGTGDGCGGECPNECAGCCDVSHLCQSGDAGPACGSGGGACAICASPAYCEDATTDGGYACCTPQCADKCDGAPDECGGSCPVSDCAGCCDVSHVCHPEAIDPANGVFVLAGGSSDASSCGSATDPCGSVQLGINVAQATGKTIVYVGESGSPYVESITLDANLTVEGGWSRTGGAWSPVCDNADQAVVIQAPPNATTTVLADALGGAATLSTLTIQSKDQASVQPGESLYGIFARGSSTTLALNDVVVQMANAGDGLSGDAGTPGVSTTDSGCEPADAGGRGGWRGGRAGARFRWGLVLGRRVFGRCGHAGGRGNDRQPRRTGICSTVQHMLLLLWVLLCQLRVLL